MSIPEIGVSINLSNLNISEGDKIGNLLDEQNDKKNTDENTTQDNVKVNDLSNKQSEISFNKENTTRNGTQRKTEERYSGGRANDAITAIIRGSQGTSSKTFGLEKAATGETSQDDRNDKQEELIKEWANEQGIWYEDTDKEFRVKYGDPIAKEGESTVFYDKERGVAVKSKNTLQYHDLLEAIIGVKLHNEKFPEAPITITGFGNDSEGFVMVIEQPFISQRAYSIRTMIKTIGSYLRSAEPYLSESIFH